MSSVAGLIRSRHITCCVCPYSGKKISFLKLILLLV